MTTTIFHYDSQIRKSLKPVVRVTDVLVFGKGA